MYLAIYEFLLDYNILAIYLHATLHNTINDFEIRW